MDTGLARIAICAGEVDARANPHGPTAILLAEQLLPAFGFSIVVIVLLLASAPLVNAVPGDKDVRVVNTTAEPVPMLNINDARQPAQLATNSTQNGTNVSVETIGTVPACKRLVIEFVTMTGQVPAGQHAEISGSGYLVDMQPKSRSRPTLRRRRPVSPS